MSHVPSRHYHSLIRKIIKNHRCYNKRKAYWEVATTYCVCSEATYSEGFPAVEMDLGGFKFSFGPEHYLMWDARQKACLVTFQEEKRKVYFWLMGDPFLRAFFSLYDVENRRLGLLNMSLPAGSPSRKVEDRFDVRDNYAMLALVFCMSLIVVCLFATSIFMVTRKCCLEKRKFGIQLQAAKEQAPTTPKKLQIVTTNNAMSTTVSQPNFTSN